MGLVSTNGKNCKRGKITIEIRQVIAEYGNEKKIIFFLGGVIRFCVLPQCGKTFLVVYKRIEEFCRLYLQKSTILP